MTPPPIPNSYWVVENILLASEYPGHRDPKVLRQKLEKFLDAGIRSFIDLTFEAELQPYVAVLRELARERSIDVNYFRMPIGESGLPGSREEMCRILDQIDSCRVADQACCVHCWGGCGRTGMVVGCYLVRRGMAAQEALDFINARWRSVAKYPRYPNSPETEAQRIYILNWQLED